MTTRLTAFLDSSQSLQNLSQRAKFLATLQNHYRQIAPPSLAQASRVMQLHGSTLILAADNGAVAAKLRQISPEMIPLFQTRGYEITGIQIRVQVRIRATPAPLPPRTISKTGRKALEDLSLDLPESPLKSALRRLSRH